MPNPPPPPTDIPERLESERLLLEPYQPGDGAWLHAVLKENRAHLADSLAGIEAGLGLDLTKAHDAEIFVRQLGLDWAARRRFILAAREKTSGSFVGDIWIEAVDWSVPLCEIGYFVVAQHLGKGYATEATLAGLGFIFGHLQAAKTRITTDADNAASCRVAERCGFVLEGRLRAEGGQRNGALVDKLHYGLLREEFVGRPKER